jgi:hypothetical protein
MAELLVILFITAVVTATTRPGRAAVKNFAASAHKATGWRTPRAALHHYSGRLGALAGRRTAATARGGRKAAGLAGQHATAIAGRHWQARRAAGGTGPLIWRTRPRAPGDGTSGNGATAPTGTPPATGRFWRGAKDGTLPPDVDDVMIPGTDTPASPRKRRVCVACGNPEYGPRRGGGNWGPVVVYDEPDAYGWIIGPRFVHKAHFDDELTGYYGRPFQPVPGPGGPDDPGGGSPAADRDGAGSPPATAPSGAERRKNSMTSRYALNLEPPQTDGEFLESCVQLGDVLKSLAEEIANWADGLGALNLPQSVLNPLHQVSDGITDAAAGAAQAAKAFEDEFEDARDVAARGMHFTGQDAA